MLEILTDVRRLNPAGTYFFAAGSGVFACFDHT